MAIKIKILLLLLFTLGIAIYLTFPSTKTPEHINLSPQTQNPLKLEKYTQGENPINYVIVKKDSLDKLQLFYKNAAGEKYKTISNLKSSLEVQGKRLFFATNAGIFSEEFEPLGLYIQDYQIVSKLNTGSGPGNFHLLPNGVFLLDNSGAKIQQTKKYSFNKDIRFALQSGPMLLVDGNINPQFTKNSDNLHIRSGVGLTSNGDLVFAISGRLTNFYDFASFFKALDCQNALYLDGTISELFVSGQKESTVQSFAAMIGLTD